MIHVCLEFDELLRALRTRKAKFNEVNILKANVILNLGFSIRLLDRKCF